MIKPATATCSSRKLTRKYIETDEEEDETDLALSMSSTDESDSESEEYGQEEEENCSTGATDAIYQALRSLTRLIQRPALLESGLGLFIILAKKQCYTWLK